jgi:cytochrome c oxidase subunit 2
MQSWFPFIPESASTYSGDVDALYFYISGVTVFFTLLISFVIIFFVVKYRRRNPFEIPRPIEGSMKLETLWSVIPLLIAMSIFFWGAKIYFNQYRPPKNAIEVYVVGKQWMWKFQHATGQREINELHVPVGRKIKLIMATEDVIHDVFVPAFRIKADVVPGRYTTEWFEATKPGRYHFFCAEYCGMNHSGMGGWVVVLDPTEYENWLSGNANQMSPAAAGQQMFESLGCASCHGANAEGGRGPALLGVYGSNVVLNTNQSVRADEAYLRESILNPQAKIVNGFGPIMPSFQGQLSEEQLLQLVAYVKSLSAPKTETQTAKPPPVSAKPSATPVSTPKK